MPVDANAVRKVVGNPRPRDLEVTCAGCRRRPYQIPHFAEIASEVGGRELLTPEDLDAWVRREEGTFNPETNRFLCDPCYIRAGTPSLHQRPGWKCP